MADATPNPHRDEPIPAPDEGLRPEADPSVVRPDQDEELGPVPGLLATAAAEAVEEVTDSPEAEEQMEDAGVEEEGIESGQILGITIAIIASVFLLSFTVYWAFYLPKLGGTVNESESVVELSAEGRTLMADAEALIGDYSLTADSVYTLPIGVAMEDVAREYAGNAAVAALDGDSLGASGTRSALPAAVTRAGFNVAPIALNPQRAVRAASDRGAFTAPVPETATDAPNPFRDAQPVTDEEVGVDDFDDPGNELGPEADLDTDE